MWSASPYSTLCDKETLHCLFPASDLRMYCIPRPYHGCPQDFIGSYTKVTIHGVYDNNVKQLHHGFLAPRASLCSASLIDLRQGTVNAIVMWQKNQPAPRKVLIN